MPWYEGIFDPVPEFASVRPLFDRERELLEADDIDAWCRAWDELADKMVLEPLDGREAITEFLLHIEAVGRQASWRYCELPPDLKKGTCMIYEIIHVPFPVPAESSRSTA